MRKHFLSNLTVSRALTQFAVFMLTCGLAACDLPGGSGAITAKNAAQGSSGADLPASRNAVSAASQRLAAVRQGEFQPAAESWPQLPPVEDMQITPMEKAGDPAGNAMLSVLFRNGSDLPDVFPLVFDDREFVFRRDSAEKSRFNGMVVFDFDLFAREQEDRRKLIVETKATSTAVFDGRSFIADGKLEFIDPTTVARARALSLPLSISSLALSMPASAVDPRRELMITDLSVVNDPVRTFDICGKKGDPDGAWTFKTLMTNMANQSYTTIDPAVFTEKWLMNWTVNHTINTFPVPARPNIGALVLNSWPRIGGKLDLDSAPFRLLAIVNRIDLRNKPGYGGGAAGEGRLVFGVVDRKNKGGCSVTNFTVIFEYGVPISGCTNVQNYGQKWVNLGNISMGSPAFNPALQAITDQFTTADANMQKPNRSALNQLRSNENALNPWWELREFVLPGKGPVITWLGITSTKQTPHHTLNNTALLASYINANAPSIINGTYSVPDLWAGQPFLTGSTLNGSVADAAVWKAPGVGNQERHLFSLGTCNACHGGETRANGSPFVSFPPPPNGQETDFVHIDVRLPTAPSNLSKFLVGTGNLGLPAVFPKNDPINTVPTRKFGDLLRRQSDLANLMNTSCSSTAMLQKIQFQPLNMPH